MLQARTTVNDADTIYDGIVKIMRLPVPYPKAFNEDSRQLAYLLPLAYSKALTFQNSR